MKIMDNIIYDSPFEKEELLRRLSRIEHVVLDMDGTVYMGGTLFGWTHDFLAGLREMGIGYSFLTNNPSRSVADYLAKLDAMGIRATPDEVYTTSLATIEYIGTNCPEVRSLFIVGTPSMVREFEAAGFRSTAESNDDPPDMLVVGFDTDLDYRRLCRAAWWASQGIPYLATNPDRVCPTDQPTVLIDCGSVCAAIEHATGRRPDLTLGKPDPGMLSDIMARHGLKADTIAMVGDRIYTDVATARAAGAFGVLVLSGETTAQRAACEDPQPDLTTASTREFGELLHAALSMRDTISPPVSELHR